MTATLRPEVGTIADKLQEAVMQEGLIDAMPDRFFNELVDNGIETVEQFEDAYAGDYSSGADFAEQLCDDCGYLCETNLPSWIVNHIDWQAVWDCELRHDYCTIEYDGVTYFFSRHF